MGKIQKREALSTMMKKAMTFWKISTALQSTNGNGGSSEHKIHCPNFGASSPIPSPFMPFS
jgi:hypothetical protein|tara:strand:+ start:258 stop:440 length:183 start_codon:yes stop_codon:yes gene_type:complete